MDEVKTDRHSQPAPEPKRYPQKLIAPRNAVELHLLAIWEKILGVRRLGIRDSFFDLGGTSLQAARIVNQIQLKFDRVIPVTALIHGASAERMALFLTLETAPASWQALTPIQREGTEPPLFCIHGQNGSVFSYKPLADYLGKEQPVYGLQAGEVAPETRVEDMAAEYIKEIRTVQPVGPYFLAGYSSGGVVAFEMAQQLTRAGEKVALLALFDTLNPALLDDTPTLGAQLRTHWINLSRLNPLQKLNYIVERGKWKSFELVKKMSGKFSEPDRHSNSDEIPDIFQRIEETNRQAFINYIPQVYPGKLTLFLAIERPAAQSSDSLLGWGELAAGGVEIQEVPGHYKTLMQEPRVRVLAEKLSASLRKAQVVGD
ncbi:thioesterase domain-containing protein [Kamptonema formosum]|uniref:thioesterase domain-containing protein n=1 Tax=Kamptonema formosum TaxID=331992 RepID=UPI00034AE12F|nr:thioesterase domain-containing protein [Oscillatoria sp. PCC 10802]